MSTNNKIYSINIKNFKLNKILNIYNKCLLKKILIYKLLKNYKILKSYNNKIKNIKNDFLLLLIFLKHKTLIIIKNQKKILNFYKIINKINHNIQIKLKNNKNKNLIKIKKINLIKNKNYKINIKLYFLYGKKIYIHKINKLYFLKFLIYNLNKIKFKLLYLHIIIN